MCVCESNVCSETNQTVDWSSRDRARSAAIMKSWSFSDNVWSLNLQLRPEAASQPASQPRNKHDTQVCCRCLTPTLFAHHPAGLDCSWCTDASSPARAFCGKLFCHSMQQGMHAGSHCSAYHCMRADASTPCIQTPPMCGCKAKRVFFMCVGWCCVFVCVWSQHGDTCSWCVLGVFQDVMVWLEHEPLQTCRVLSIRGTSSLKVVILLIEQYMGSMCGLKQVWRWCLFTWCTRDRRQDWVVKDHSMFGCDLCLPRESGYTPPE